MDAVTPESAPTVQPQFGPSQESGGACDRSTQSCGPTPTAAPSNSPGQSIGPPPPGSAESESRPTSPGPESQTSLPVPNSGAPVGASAQESTTSRSEEHTSELQSPCNL